MGGLAALPPLPLPLLAVLLSMLSMPPVLPPGNKKSADKDAVMLRGRSRRMAVAAAAAVKYIGVAEGVDAAATAADWDADDAEVEVISRGDFMGDAENENGLTEPELDPLLLLLLLSELRVRVAVTSAWGTSSIVMEKCDEAEEEAEESMDEDELWLLSPGTGAREKP